MIDLANDTNYGLAAYVYTAEPVDRDAGLRGAALRHHRRQRRQPDGRVGPVRGHEGLGLGREGSHDGIAEYLETKLGGFAV